MRIFVDTANLEEIGLWDAHPWVSGFTTNPTLMRGIKNGMEWAREAVALTDKPISIDGPPEVWNFGENVYRKVVDPRISASQYKTNLTAICSIAGLRHCKPKRHDIISVFCGRIMDTGRDPQPVIDAAKAIGAQVLWASVREPYNIIQAENSGCDIITVPPVILGKWLAWRDKPLEVVAAETVAQFDKDREGLW